MSTKNQTTGSNTTAFQFNPASMAAYTKNLSQFLPFAQSLYQNPFGNSMFNQESSINQDQAMNIGARNKSNILANANAMGYSTNGGLFNSMVQRAGRDTGNLQAQGFRSAVLNANQRAMQGLGISSAFQPLMTGSNGTFNQTQTTGGLGTWLPQLAGALGGAAMNAFAPGAGSVIDGASGLGMGMPNQVAPNAVPSPNFGGVGFGSPFNLSGIPSFAPTPGFGPPMPPGAYGYGGTH